MKNLQVILVLAFLSLGTLSFAQTAPIDDNGLAIGGYDVVAYFSGEAAQGSETFSTTYNDATYYFASAEHLAAFKKAPTQYLPQFDGYCAWGVGAKEAKFPINPETFDIIDGKLYLFFNGPFNGESFNTLMPWNAETSKLVTASHANWGKMKK
ncbi:MAG: YHS domain-containing (seleno)protein [Bacteroidota bacterium]